jgi:electron transport complex protein RnfB
MSWDFIPHIDTALCIGCELCIKLCPSQALAMVGEIAHVSAPEACNYTGVCQEICPTQAISLVYEIVFVGEIEEG